LIGLGIGLGLILGYLGFELYGLGLGGLGVDLGLVNIDITKIISNDLNLTVRIGDPSSYDG
jgi:hypothetical protein